MKNLKFLFVIILFPLLASSQQLSGTWVGVLTNDSMTVRKDQSFELALTEYKGKVYGYSYSTFIVNDTLYYIVKRVTGKIEEGVCEVSDDEIISNNFYKKRDKGVKQTTVFKLNPVDNTWYIDGTWKTEATKKYYALSGVIKLKEERDHDKSRLYEQLGDLNLTKTLSFTTSPEKKKEIIPEQKEKKDLAKTKEKIVDKKSESDVAKNTTKIPEQKPNRDDVTKPDVVISKPELKKPDVAVADQSKEVNKVILKPEEKPLEKKPDVVIAKPELKKPDVAVADQSKEVNKVVLKPEEKPLEKKPDVVIAKPELKKPDVAVADQSKEVNKVVLKSEEKLIEKKPDIVIAKPELKKPDVAAVEQNKKTKKDDKKTEPEFVFTDLKRTEFKLKPPAALVNERESVPSETIFFKQDSLILALYDNGEVDGDTVSVILNGDIIIAKQGLKSSAFKKTIYIAPDESDSILLVLYAENLGLYPPNTGLLIIKDGDETYQVRFKADYDRNAAILLKRKSK